MCTTLCNTLLIQLQQGPTMSIVALDLSWQSSIEDTPQAQGMHMPIFGEDCLSKPLT